VLGTKKSLLSLQVVRHALSTWLEGLEIMFDQLTMWRENHINHEINVISVTSTPLIEFKSLLVLCEHSCDAYLVRVKHEVVTLTILWKFTLSYCWRKMCTQRQTHSKPKSLASHAQRESDVPVNFSWKLTKNKTVKYQSLEPTGWYQAVPYLRLRSQARRHVAMRSYLPKNHNHSGNREGKKNIAEWMT
jgi:hypothetical protein